MCIRDSLLLRAKSQGPIEGGPSMPQLVHMQQDALGPDAAPCPLDRVEDPASAREDRRAPHGT
eukprot:10987573-Alexandrium_andersonii.AAC.1